MQSAAEEVRNESYQFKYVTIGFYPHGYVAQWVSEVQKLTSNRDWRSMTTFKAFAQL